MANIKLYSTGCPKCNVLKKKLDAVGIKYDIITDMELIKEACNMAKTDMLPILSVLEGEKGDKLFEITFMDFSRAIKWVGEQSNAN